MQHLYLLAIAFIGLLPFQLQAQHATYHQQADGVTISYAGLSTSVDQEIRLKVVRPEIIHVVAQPLAHPYPIKSSEAYIVSPGRSDSVPPFQLHEDVGKLQLQTSAMSLSISLLNGSIEYTNKEGKSILSELPRSATSFYPSMTDGDAFYHINQPFRMDSTSGLYGLGQHQNGVMNYQGRQVSLLQYNTEVAVPFLLSTENYGILWNNYSITTAGDVRPLLPLSSLKLSNIMDQPGWLDVHYLKKDHLQDTLLRLPVSTIDYNFLSDTAKFPHGIDMANSLVVYEGHLASPINGLHRLHIKYAGYLKVYIDGELQADRWRESWNAGTFELDLHFHDQEKKAFRMEWLPEGNQSYLGLQVQLPLASEASGTFSFASEAGAAIDYYFIGGNSMDSVISGYRQLTGKAPIMPRWAYGYWQSRERYKTQEELMDIADGFRKRKIPIDNLVLDWSYWPEKDWGSQEFESSRFPDPKGMIEKLHHNNYHFMLSVWPKFNEEAPTYGFFKDKGWLYLRNIAEQRKDWIGKGYTSTFYDPFNPEAREGFWQLLDEKLYSKGVDAFWMDASEPDIHSNLNITERKSVFTPAVGSSTRYYNAYPLLNAKGIYEGQRRSDPNKRVFMLTRSGFAGQQRYAAAVWSGDIASRWHDMRDQIAAGLNFSMSGLPYWTMDAGGFLVEKRFHEPDSADQEEWRELNARWFQYGSFLPIFRAHGQYPFREPFNIAPEDHPAYRSMLYSIKLRYRLLPYTYSMAGKIYLHDYTLLRGLAMDFPTDQQVFNINDQFMYGSAFLVNPITEKAVESRPLYLPSGTDWYDFYTGQHHSGGQQINANAPYDRMPLFVRAGAIIPIGPELQYTDEKAATAIDLYVYEGQDGTFTLYEDEGTNYNYEQGEYSTIAMEYNNQSKTLTFSERKGTFKGNLKARQFNVFFVAAQSPIGFDQQQKPANTIRYKGSKLQINLTKNNTQL